VADFKSKQSVYLGTGRRKTAVARVRLSEGSGQVTINKKSVEQYFTETKDRQAVYGPLDLVEMRKRVDVRIKVHGGGYSGQAGAVCQGIARALKEMFNLPPAAAAPAPTADGTAHAEGGAPEDPIVVMGKRLRDSGYLTRDGRMKERKKYGRKGARKSFQFSKR
jgi:small subunit ribosomal protein S9